MTPQSKQSLIAALRELAQDHELTSTNSINKVIALDLAMIPIMRKNMNANEIIAFFASNLALLLETDILSRPGILEANDVVQAATKIINEGLSDAK